MPRPDLGEFAEEIYAELYPFIERSDRTQDGKVVDDEDNDWAMLVFFGALAARWQEIEDLARDSDAGPGWSIILDLARIPDKGLPYIGQFKGQVSLDGLSAAQRRTKIASAQSFERGSPEAIIDSAKTHLTGAKRVLFAEAVEGNPFLYYVVTFAADTPDEDQVLADLKASKPYWYLFDYHVSTDWDYGALRAAFPSYGDVADYFADYADLRDESPSVPTH